jgi:hypothetical protein
MDVDGVLCAWAPAQTFFLSSFLPSFLPSFRGSGGVNFLPSLLPSFRGVEVWWY